MLLCIGILVGAIVFAPMIGYARFGLMRIGSDWRTPSFLLIDFLPVALGALLLLVSLGAAKYRVATMGCGALIGVALYETFVLIMYPPLTDGSLLSGGIVYGPAFALLTLASVSIWKTMFARGNMI